MKSIVVTDCYQKKLQNQSHTDDERIFVRDFNKNQKMPNHFISPKDILMIKEQVHQLLLENWEH